jgi:DNA-binding NarL/FixJ family response regulator
MAATRPDPPRLFLVDSHPVLREALRYRLETGHRFLVVGEAADIPEALVGIAATNPQVAVIDVTLGHETSLLLVQRVHTRHPGVRLLIWTAYCNPQFVAEAMRTGAHGYVPKNAPTEEIMMAIETLIDGRCYCSPSLEQMPVRIPDLTPHERMVLRKVARGRTCKQIAKERRCSFRTIEGYRKSLMDKLGVNKEACLIITAIRFGLLNINDFDDDDERPGGS